MRKKKPIYHLSRFPKQVKRMTKKIFDEDVMLRKCEAQVTDCIELKDGFGIELDQTVFYPEGGGQLSDTGELLIGEKTVAVIHVREKDGHIFHETKAPVATGTKVEAQIHWCSSTAASTCCPMPFGNFSERTISISICRPIW